MPSHLLALDQRVRRGLRRYARTTFSSLKIRNYRLYFTGQAISLCGTWMQSIGQSWLVLKLTGSGTALGLVTALQFLPVLLLAPYGGVLADRYPKRRILFLTQSAQAVLALALGGLVLSGHIRLWMLYVFAGLLGLTNAADNPARQSFVHELVGREQLRNAVTLNSVEVNLTRVIGPAIAGALIAAVGLAPCFLINGVSYVAVLACLVMMRARELHSTERPKPEKGQLRAGVAYVARTRVLRDVLLMMAIVGTLAYEFPVILPLLVKFTFHREAGTYALFTSSMGVGSVIGGLAAAGLRRNALKALTLSAFAFGGSILLLALSPNLALAIAFMVVVGVFSVLFTSLTNAILQLESAPQMRARVMALWAVAFLGTTPIGGPIVGWTAEHSNPRWGLVLGAAAAAIAGVVGLAAQKARARQAETTSLQRVPRLEPAEKPAG